jgi:hypothetical protein
MTLIMATELKLDPSAGTMILRRITQSNIRTVTQLMQNSKTLTIVYEKYGRPKSKVQPDCILLL